VKLSRSAWFALCSFSLSVPAALAAPTPVVPAAPAPVVLGTATPGGGFPVYGEAFAATVNEFEPALRVEPRNTKGSTENVPLLEAGKLDIALVQGEAAQEALGIGGKPPTLSIIAAMYSQPGMFVVRADSPARSIADLKGKPVAFGTRGSGLTILSGLVLDGMGLDRERDFQAIYLDRAGDGPPMVLDGRAAALWGAGVGWPGFVRVAESPGGARFIAPSPEDARRILARHPHLRALTVPPGSFPGQTEAIRSVGSWSFVLARPGLPDDVAYRIARALHRGEAALAARLPQARETTPKNTVEAAPRVELIHPGALRYLREAGFAP
jgi:TRAP transporter TAXI family solute receptor